MFVIFLNFSANKANAKDFMVGHNQWLNEYFDKNIFLLAGSVTPQKGGIIIAHNCEEGEINNIISQDPFVIENIVTPEILEIVPSKINETIKNLGL